MAKRRKKTNKNVPAKGRLRDIADQLWSLAVRGDWNWRCAVCGNSKVEAHHLSPRQHEETRYLLRNGIALCSRHHQFCPDVSPHQNAAGWLEWLEHNHPKLAVWYQDLIETGKHKEFNGVKNAHYYCDVNLSFREFVPEGEFREVVGIRFSEWLETEYCNG